MSDSVHPPSAATGASVMTSLIESRRSVKPARFADRPVSDEIVWQMLRNANWAPTHGMTEPWRFFVYAREARKAFGHRLAEIYEEITPPDARKPGKSHKFVTNAEQSSHLILIAMCRQSSGKIPEVEEIEAVACAVQNLHLTATAYGVGGYWSSGKAICSDVLRAEIGLSEKDRILGLFYVGYPAGDWPTGTRGPIEEKVIWNG